MAVIKAKPRKAIESFIQVVDSSLLAPKVITQISGELFKGAAGDEVVLETRKRRTRSREYEFRTRTSPIQMDDISGGEELVIKLDTHVYTASAFTDEHLTLDDIDFVEEVFEPQADAIAADYETRAVQALHNVDAKTEIDFSVNDDPYLIALEANRRMSSFKTAPNTGRVLIVGSNVAASWLASDRLSRYDSTGETGTPALRNATIGRIGNLRVLEIPELDPNEAFLQHQSSLVLASVAPIIPRGVIAGAYAQRDGYGMRWIADYDAAFLRDRSIISTFLGINELKDERYLSDGYHDPETGANVAQGTPGAVEHRIGDTKPDAIAKNVRIIPLHLTDFDATDGLLDETP